MKVTVGTSYGYQNNRQNFGALKISDQARKSLNIRGISDPGFLELVESAERTEAENPKHISVTSNQRHEICFTVGNRNFCPSYGYGFSNYSQTGALLAALEEAR